MDLSKAQIETIYKSRPEIFNNRKSKRALKEIGIKANIEPLMATIEIPSYNLDEFMSFDVREDFIESILSGEYYYEDYFPDIDDLVDMLNSSNQRHIEKIIAHAASTDLFAHKMDISELSTKEAIEQLGLDDVVHSLQDAYGRAFEHEAYKIVHEEIKRAIDEFGDLEKTEWAKSRRWNAKQGKYIDSEVLSFIVKTYDLDDAFDSDMIDEVIENYGLDETDVEEIIKAYYKETGLPETNISRKIDYLSIDDKYFNEIFDEIKPSINGIDERKMSTQFTHTSEFSALLEVYEGPKEYDKNKVIIDLRNKADKKNDQRYSDLANHIRDVETAEKEIKATKDEIKVGTKELIADLFTAEEAVMTRVVRVNNAIFTLSKDPEPTTTIQYKKVLDALCKVLTPELRQKLEELKEEYSSTSQRLASLKLEFAGGETILTLQAHLRKFLERIQRWSGSFDHRYANFEVSKLESPE